MSRIENSNLSLKDIYFLLENPEEIKLNDSLKTKINQSFNRTQKMAKDPKPIYGINTGVGPLCTKKISPEDTKSLQRNLLLSHSVGVGNPISPELSRIMLLCKIKSLSRGFSGISLDLLDRLIYFLQHNLNYFCPLILQSSRMKAYLLNELNGLPTFQETKIDYSQLIIHLFL